MMNFLIRVEKDGTVLEIHPTTLKAHMAAGWIERKEINAGEVVSEKNEVTQSQPKPAQPKTKKG